MSEFIATGTINVVLNNTNQYLTKGDLQVLKNIEMNKKISKEIDHYNHHLQMQLLERQYRPMEKQIDTVANQSEGGP